MQGLTCPCRCKQWKDDARPDPPPCAPLEDGRDGPFGSDLVNEAVKTSFAEDADDLAAFDLREPEPSYAFEDMVKDLRKRGKL